MVQFNGLKNQPQQIYVANNQATQQTDFLVKSNVRTWSQSIYILLCNNITFKLLPAIVCNHVPINCKVIGAVLVLVKQIFSCNDCSMCDSKREH